MYEAEADPYCYAGSDVLKNRAGLRTQVELDEFETASTMLRVDEPLPSGRLSVSHYRAIHHHLFQDVYPWAGRFRTVRLGKEGSAFCYPEHIAREMRRLFAELKSKRFLCGLSPDAFVYEAARFLAELNAIHPYREGNGRTQMLFLVLLAHHAGRPFQLDLLEPEPFLRAIIESFCGRLEPLVGQLAALTSGEGRA